MKAYNLLEISKDCGTIKHNMCEKSPKTVELSREYVEKLKPLTNKRIHGVVCKSDASFEQGCP